MGIKSSRFLRKSRKFLTRKISLIPAKKSLSQTEREQRSTWPSTSRRKAPPSIPLKFASWRFLCIIGPMFAVKAKKRDAGVKPETLKKAGEIPAVFYGAGKNTTVISVETIPFKKVWREAGESSAVKIGMPEGSIDALIHEVQVDPVTGEPIHVDFLALDMTKKIKVKIPLVFEGVSEAVKTGIGNLVKVLFELEIEALPEDLPHDLTTDISKLTNLNDQIFVSDIKLPHGVAVINNPTDVVASIVAQVEEKEEVVEPVDLSAIEVEKKGKKEEEGEGTAEAEAAAPAKEDKGEKAEKK
ncbi:TPA: 50S ribosomal protein L25 [Candidatus Nomurabacteria bacterium]|nr:50S ribosomal protein L25 [Candidatus Nomurabacteria bacterium]HBB54112.1 50S ribosomal protein L25 [Candidatus Nomurabacteria bacterium]HCC66985.1 50S ribosomal protein L25 [Candidatus Nomurabacteria bacterium]HCW88201.1 50S ribosomal protein L25 [Candidatus Nomurabacteria bacterium]